MEVFEVCFSRGIEKVVSRIRKEIIEEVSHRHFSLDSIAVDIIFIAECNASVVFAEHDFQVGKVRDESARAGIDFRPLFDCWPGFCDTGEET
jgi:hypothetical protein